ncbi:MAG: sialidase family protein [Bryobacteraceae bacterium]
MKRYACLLALTVAAFGQDRQWVEGFDEVDFHYNAHRENRATRDFRGMARGYMTAGWWAAGQMKDNHLSWKTAVVPAAKDTTFAFIAANSPLPSEFARGPEIKLSINGRYALTFTIGFNRDFTWREGEYELKYLSKRVEFPYFGSHRQFELHGNSGIYQFSVPASAVEVGRPAVLKVELLPFAGWNNGWFMVKERGDVLKQSMESLEGQIEALRQDVTNLTQLTHVLATQQYSKLVDTREFEHRMLYTNGFRHLHPADLIRLRNGELLLMSREATEHIANDGDVIMLRSKDGGRTWGEKQVIAGIKDVDEREGCGIQLRDGTIVVGVFFNGLYKADGDYNWAWRAQKFEPGKRYLGAYIITSKDNGRTWSGPNYVDTAGMPFTDVEGPTDAPVEMPDGSILLALTGYNVEGDMDNRAAVMLRSVDKGKTWKYLSTMANDPGGKMRGFTEPGLVRTKTGRLVVALRNEAPDHAVYTTYSDDDGKTWVPFRKTAMHGHPVDLIQLSDGRVMATYGIRPRSHAEPGGIRACFSHDNGETWDILTEVQLRKDFVNMDIGYPESIEMPGGRVLTVYYYNLFQRFFLGGTFWKP